MERTPVPLLCKTIQGEQYYSSPLFSNTVENTGLSEVGFYICVLFCEN